MQLAYSIYNPLYYSPTGGIYVLDDECRKDSCDVHSESGEGERGGCGKGKGEKESGGVVRLRDPFPLCRCLFYPTILRSEQI